METFYNAIDNLLQTTRGHGFFTATDAYVKTNLRLFTPWIETIERRFEDYPVVFSGEFGRLVGTQNRQRVLLPGGIRHLAKPTQTIRLDRNFVMIDDSFYGGKTLKAAEAMTGQKCVKAFVCYDGSKKRWPEVNSLFRYFEHYNHDGKRR